MFYKSYFHSTCGCVLEYLIKLDVHDKTISYDNNYKCYIFVLRVGIFIYVKAKYRPCKVRSTVQEVQL